MIWMVCALAVLLALPALAAHADEEDLNVFEENRQDVAQAMVAQAIGAFEEDREAAISMMRDPENPLFHDGNVYVFLVDGEGTFLAHAGAPDLIGTSMHGLTDPEGTELGTLFESSGSSHGGWALYTGAYPDSGHEGPIKAWLVTAWGHIFGAAIYRDADSRMEIYLTERERERQDAAREMAEQAIRAFSRDPDLAVSLIHDPEDTLFHDGELYTMIVHRNGTIIADGYAPRLAGTDIDTLEDALGANLGDIFEENDSAYGRWVDYYWPDPRVTLDHGELKLTWIKAYGDHVFAVGVYPEDPDTDRDDAPSHHDASRKDAAREMTQTAIRMFGQDPERAVSLIHDGDNRLFHDAELYPIVADQSGIVVAHGNAPYAAGTHISDVEYGDGVTLDSVFRSGSPYGNWVEHEGTHPESGASTLQRTLVTYSGSYTFAVGTYPQYQTDLYPDLTQQELERLRAAQRMVEAVAESFAADPESTILAIHSPSDGPFRDKELFVVVINLNGTVVAHGYNSNIAGVDIEYLSDTRGANIGDLIEENLSVYGRWIEYHWPNPVSNSGAGEPKLSWYRVSGDHIFGAGTYPASLG